MDWPSAASHAWEILFADVSGHIKAIIILVVLLLSIGGIIVLIFPGVRRLFASAASVASGTSPTLAEIEQAAARGVRSAFNRDLVHLKEEVIRLRDHIGDLRDDIAGQGREMAKQGERISTIEGRLSVQRGG